MRVNVGRRKGTDLKYSIGQLNFYVELGNLILLDEEKGISREIELSKTQAQQLAFQLNIYATPPPPPIPGAQPESLFRNLPKPIKRKIRDLQDALNCDRPADAILRRQIIDLLTLQAHLTDTGAAAVADWLFRK